MDDPSPACPERTVGDLIEPCLDDLRTFVRRRAGQLVLSRESSGDLVQSVCRELLQHRGRFRHDGPQHFRRWVFATALRKVIDRERHWRRDKRHPERERRLPSETELRDGAGVCQRFTDNASPCHIIMQRESLENALAQLPEQYRDVIVMARVLGMTHDEIALHMGRTRASIDTLLSRALARLMSLLVSVS